MPSKYENYRNNLINTPGISSELKNFDWFEFQSTAPVKIFMPDHISVMNVINETNDQRKLRMLRQLSLTCTACSMCELGLKGAERNDDIRDPHVFSSMNPSSRFMVVMDSNSQWTELYNGKPKLEDRIITELAKYNLSEDIFYICRIIRCYGNTNAEHFTKCSVFLQIEFNLLKPVLVIIFHEAAFAFLCPNESFTKFAIVKSSFGINVLPISSLDKIKSLGGLIHRLQSKTNTVSKQT